MNRRTYSALIALIALTITVLLAGCAATPRTSGAQTSPVQGGSTVVAGPTIKVLAPLDGAVVKAGEIVIKLETTGLKFAMPSTKLVPGEGHVHFTLDSQPIKMSATPDYALSGVTPGPHTLKAELVQNDTTPFDPPVLQTVAFTAK